MIFRFPTLHLKMYWYCLLWGFKWGLCMFDQRWGSGHSVTDCQAGNMSGDTQPDSSDLIREKLEDLKSRYGFREPDRGNLDDPEIHWRMGKPDYTKANYQFLKGKTQNHAEGRKVSFKTVDQLCLEALWRRPWRILWRPGRLKPHISRISINGPPSIIKTTNWPSMEGNSHFVVLITLS